MTEKQADEQKGKVLRKLSEVFIRLKRWEQAEAIISMIEEGEDRSEALCELGEALVHEQQWEQAEVIISMIVESEARAEALCELGETLAKAQRWEHAEVIIRMIVESEARAEALRELGEILAKAQRWEQAGAVLAEAETTIYLIENKRPQVELLCKLGETLLRIQQRRWAETVWKKAEETIFELAVQDNTPEVLMILAEALAKAGEYERLLQVVQRAWLKPKSKENTHQLLPLAYAFAIRDFDIALAFCDDFTWVDTSLQGFSTAVAVRKDKREDVSVPVTPTLSPTQAPNVAPEQTFSSLPRVSQDAWRQENSITVEMLSAEDQQRIERAMLEAQEFLEQTNTTKPQFIEISPNLSIMRDLTPLEEKELELELVEQLAPESAEHAQALNDLADLLVKEVQEGRAAQDFLVKARRYATHALNIAEQLDTTLEIWKILSILARVAFLEGHVEEAQTFRRQEHEAFAASAVNRYEVAQQSGWYVNEIIHAAEGDKEAQAKVEKGMTQMASTSEGRKLMLALQLLWSGERDWHTLTEDLNRRNALMILLALDGLITTPDIESHPLIQAKASLSLPLREAIKQKDASALKSALESLPQEEQTKAIGSLSLLLKAEEEADDLYQLGMSAQERGKWMEAKHCFYKSLMLKQVLDDTAGIAEIYSELAFVAG